MCWSVQLPSSTSRMVDYQQRAASARRVIMGWQCVTSSPPKALPGRPSAVPAHRDAFPVRRSFGWCRNICVLLLSSSPRLVLYPVHKPKRTLCIKNWLLVAVSLLFSTATGTATPSTVLDLELQYTFSESNRMLRWGKHRTFFRAEQFERMSSQPLEQSHATFNYGAMLGMAWGALCRFGS
jgi:hypothetical protein